MNKSELKKRLMSITGHSFMVGFYTACIVILIIALVHSAVTGGWGPVKKAIDSVQHVPIEVSDGEEDAGGSEMQPDEQSNERDGERR